jgi:hypothetical protein
MALNIGLGISLDKSRTGKEYERKQGMLTVQKITNDEISC